MACGVLCPLPGRAASLPGEGSTHLRGCGMTAVGAKRPFTRGQHVMTDEILHKALSVRAEAAGDGFDP